MWSGPMVIFINHTIVRWPPTYDCRLYKTSAVLSRQTHITRRNSHTRKLTRTKKKQLRVPRGESNRNEVKLKGTHLFVGSICSSYNSSPVVTRLPIYVSFNLFLGLKNSLYHRFLFYWKGSGTLHHIFRLPGEYLKHHWKTCHTRQLFH